ncbi:amidohydrolase family protein [Nocardioides nitrophenolicus]|uniref:amidohydrolase family protein n=1 Tax=Nocardioides nitrophenolicus TaxID=60489 RepID=UPI00195932ED|nr:amidohydrolase family protein [Nocardioides nitrophenolicus]MBM7517676.1 putative TIM-barrel fold metal-dependent hydrolase [Nocardioides nitrophenolicus]
MTPPTIVDAHAHLWDPAAHPWYPGLHAFAEHAASPWLLDRHRYTDYADHHAGVPLGGLVHVSAATAPHAYLAEARWLEEELAAAPVPAVTIGTVDPLLPAAELVAHLDEQAASVRFRGARVYGGLEPDSPATPVLLDWLAGHGLVFDLVASPGSLPAWVDVLAAHPGLAVVLEHLGTPHDITPDGRAAWAATQRTVAESTDWVCKFSGLGMVLPEVDADTVRPWLEGAVDAWGWDRLLFGSNMPIDSLHVRHADLLAVIVPLVGSLASPAEAERFFAGNTRATYDLPVAG